MGKKIGKYEIGKTLGSGNFSKVKLGVDSETGETWAIKIIDKEQLQRDHMEEQLKREIALMKQLRHENIVQLKEVMQTQNHIYLVLELVTGGELFDKIVAAKRLEEGIARRYFQQLVMAVLCCHQNGVAHRDIKPENLLLDSNDNVKISDFGLSNLQPTGGKDLLQTVCGTPNYVAPEVLKEKGYNGFQADAWSCGIVLFVMLAGYLPFDDQNINALFNKIERGDYRMARNISTGAADLISKLLVVDPNRRLTMEQVTQHPWFQVGFDTAKLEASRRSFAAPSQDDVRSAVRDANLEDTGAAAAASGPSSPAGAAGARNDGVLDAFDVIGKLTAGTLHPLSSNDNNVARTNFKWFVSASTADINAVLSTAIKGNPKVNANEIKGFINGPKGLLTYICLVNPTTIEGVNLLEVRRGRGDIFDFHALARQIATALGPRCRSAITDEAFAGAAATA